MEYVNGIVDLEKEIQDKEDWMPDADDAVYRDVLQKRFQWAVWQMTNSLTYMNGMTPLEYYQINLEDSVLVTQPLPDTDDWRNNIRLNDLIDKRDAFLAFRETLNFKAEFSGQDIFGKERMDAADIAEVMVEYAKELDQYDEKTKLYNYGLFDFGTQFVRVTWEETPTMKRVEPSPFDPMRPERYRSFARYKDTFRHIKTDYMQFNRVFLGDVSQWFIDDQPYYFIDYIIPYETAYQIFHTWKRWKYVKPYLPADDAWTDLLPDYEIDDPAFKRTVRVRIYEDLPNQTMALALNSVVMTPRNLKLPNGIYSLIQQQAGVLNPRCTFGKSFLSNMHNYAMIKDLMANIMVDRSRQDLEPPMKSTFRTLLTRHMFRPSAVSQILGQGTLEPLIPETAMRNFAMEVYKMIEGQMDKASVSPVFQGQQQGGSQTKYEVQQQLYNSLRAVELWVQASARMEYQIAGKILDLALKNYPKMPKVGDKAKRAASFCILGLNGDSKKDLRFQELPDNTTKAGKSERLDMLKDMSKEQKQAKAQGQTLKMYVADPRDTSNWRWSLKMKVVPEPQETKAQLEDQVRQDYRELLQNPIVNPEFPTKMWFRAKGWDFEEAKKTQEQMAPPAQPGQPGQGGQPPAGEGPDMQQMLQGQENGQQGPPPGTPNPVQPQMATA